MFQGFLQKNKEEIALSVGNITIFILLLVSFIWFLIFSISVINGALNIKVNAGEEGSQQLKMDEFKKIKDEFFMKEFGMVVQPKSVKEEAGEKETVPVITSTPVQKVQTPKKN